MLGVGYNVRLEVPFLYCRTDMFPALTHEQRIAVSLHPNRVATVEDDQTHEQFVLVPKQAYDRLVDPEVWRLLQPALDEVNRGKIAEWSLAEVKAAGRAHLKQ